MGDTFDENPKVVASRVRESYLTLALPAFFASIGYISSSFRHVRESKTSRAAADKDERMLKHFLVGGEAPLCLVIGVETSSKEDTSSATVLHRRHAYLATMRHWLI